MASLAIVVLAFGSRRWWQTLLLHRCRTDSHSRLVDLCERYLVARGWTVLVKGGGHPMIADLLAKRGPVEWRLFLRPVGWPFGVDYLGRAAQLATLTNQPVSILMLDSIEKACQDQGRELGVDILDVQSFTKMEESLNTNAVRWKIKLPLNLKDRGVMTNRRLMKIARRLKSESPAPRTQIDQPDQQPHNPLIASASDGADFVFVPAHALTAFRYCFPRIATCAVLADGNDGPFLRLAGGASDANSSGSTEGFGIQVADELENMASGRSIRVRVVARAEPGAGGARLAVAYSTNEVGNSGWHWFDVGPDWAVHEMVYAVPQMNAGNGDFIGLLPGEHGTGAVDIALVAALVQYGETGQGSDKGD